MKKTLLPWQLLTLVAVLAPTFYLAYTWSELPAQIPTHFDGSGQANGYTSRADMWLLTLGLPLGLGLVLSILPRLDPKRRLSSDTVNFQKLRLALVAMASSMAAYSLYAAVHPGSVSGRGIIVLVGLFFAFLGNYLTTVQPNYFVGIRTPWTLESPAVWARTHRVGGMLFCAAGVLVAGLSLVLPARWLSPMLLGLILSSAAFCYAYSYFVFRQQEKPGKTL